MLVTLRVLVDNSVVEAFVDGGRNVVTIPHCPKDPQAPMQLRLVGPAAAGNSADIVIQHVAAAVPNW